MDVDFTKAFNKQFEKLSEKKQQRAKAALTLFITDTTATFLRNHALKGKWLGYRSISAGGDFRLHFKMIDENTMLFVAAGTHSQLYR